jgi:hypothetical protein
MRGAGMLPHLILVDVFFCFYLGLGVAKILGLRIPGSPGSY